MGYDAKVLALNGIVLAAFVGRKTADLMIELQFSSYDVGVWNAVHSCPLSEQFRGILGEPRLVLTRQLLFSDKIIAFLLLSSESL